MHQPNSIVRFQWIYFAMPLVAVMIGAGLAGWWRTCLVMVVIVLLCKETTAAATFGFGLYVALFTPRRKTGSLIALVSVLYAILCITVIIPSFAADGSYQRVSEITQ